MEETKYQLLKNQEPYRILTAKEIADFFGISISSARHLCVTGAPPEPHWKDRMMNTFLGGR